MEGNKAVGNSAGRSAEICVFNTVLSPVREEDTPKERGKDAVSRYLQGCREGGTARDRKEGGPH